MIRGQVTDRCTKAACEEGVVGKGQGEQGGEVKRDGRARPARLGAVPDAVMERGEGTGGLVGGLGSRGGGTGTGGGRVTGSRGRLGAIGGGGGRGGAKAIGEGAP